MEIIRLSAEEYGLLLERHARHGNSHRSMAEALERAGERDTLEHLRALRRLERHYAVDLGSFCHRFHRRELATTHPLERLVLEHMAVWREVSGGARELWVLVDRLREVRDLIEEGELVREPES